MTVSLSPSSATYRSASSGTLLALDCARHIHAEIDRRLPEAAALATWLNQNATALGLPESDLPADPEAFGKSNRRGVLARDWRKIGTALTRASTGLANPFDTPGPQWIAAIAGRLKLDALASRILALALQYRLDRRLERLVDGMSACRGGDTTFIRDAGLIALLLGASMADVAKHLTSEAELLSSGLLCLTTRNALSCTMPCSR